MQSLNLDAETLHAHVNSRIDATAQELGIVIFPLNTAAVDWPKLMGLAFNRKPPFSAGKEEKGFRDSLVAETFYQIVRSCLQETPDASIVFAAEDKLLRSAVTATFEGRDQIKVLSSINELTNLLNTLSSSITEPEMNALRDEAALMFYNPDPKEKSLWIEEGIEGRIRMRRETPKDANLSFSVVPPTFRKKDGRMFWSSRVSVEYDYPVPAAYQTTFEDIGRYIKTLMDPPQPGAINISDPSVMPPPGSVNVGYPPSYPPAYPSGSFPTGTSISTPLYRQLVPSYRNQHVAVKYDVFWNAALTDEMQSGPKLDEIRFVETTHPQLTALWEFDTDVAEQEAAPEF